MKEFLCSWLIVQLVLLGLVGGIVHYQIDNDIFDCTDGKAGFVTIVLTTVLPLVLFVPRLGDKIKDHCSCKEPQ